MKARWENEVQRYSHGERGFVGKWVCFYVSWDSSGSGSKDAPYRLICYLPGLKENLGNFSMSEAKAKAERVLAYWLNGLNQ